MLTFRRFIHSTNPISISISISNQLCGLCTSSTIPTPPSKPSTADYDDLVNSAGQSRDLCLIRQLLIKRQNEGCFCSRHTFRFISNTQPSISFLPSLFQCIASLPKGLPRRSALHAFIHRLCRLGFLKYALQVLDEMRQRNLEQVNAYSYHPLLNALTKKKDTEGALQVLEGMKRIGMSPDTTAYNYILTAYCLKGEVIQAADLLTNMLKHKGSKADGRTYDALVLGACRAGKLEGAVALVRAAVDDGVTLIHTTYAHVIRALLEDEYFEIAIKFVLTFAGRHRGADRHNSELLANGLLGLNRFQDAKTVAIEMSKRGLPVDLKLKICLDSF